MTFQRLTLFSPLDLAALILLAVLQVVGGIVATLQASRGEPARYPFCLNLVR